jgi:photosystem II stability/assembly factor-like uncharacterized protein
VVGLDNIALTFDGGKTLIRSRTPLAEEQALDAGPVALGTPYTLAAIGYEHLYLSVDGGCHWHERGRTRAQNLSPGRQGVAYAWSWDGDVLRVTTRGVSVMKAPCARVEYVEASTQNDRHLRLLADCGVFDSSDGGLSWRRTGEPGPGHRFGTLPRTDAPLVALSQGVQGRILFQAVPDSDQPLFQSDDAGRTWAQAARPKSDVFFENDGHTAWALSFPTLERSTDGGRSFARATDLAADTHGRLVRRVRGQSPTGVLELVVDDTVKSYLTAVDKKTLAVTLVPLPLESHECGEANGKPRHEGGCTARDAAERATFVPGETWAISLALFRSSRWVQVCIVPPR